MAILGNVGCQAEVQSPPNVSVEKGSYFSSLPKSALQSSKNVKESLESADSVEDSRKKQLAQQYDNELNRALNGPDDSERADFGSPTKLRESYGSCIKRSGGATPNILDCNEEEYEYQDTRLNHVYRVLLKRLSAQEKEDLRKKERDWIKKRTTFCNLNGELGGGQAEDIEESSCKLNATARRADELELHQISK
ncbi:lysozyme inhibitor LprI family protein [Xanthomonas fragariae]|uniref:lysozyme inhibitor LprI family protein n=1 Tax=Xanthomonas fragariae TaxID=48664 RepID=UPI0022A9FBA5|nr:lysozyme inhibitor LprI family protein [Xanthomonas fragariae]WAT16157.1 lysozyme inhibitor LprI family protein [Xanthomonas fragariae]